MSSLLNNTKHKPLILFIKSPKEQSNINQKEISNSDKFNSQSHITNISPSKNHSKLLIPDKEALHNLYACILCQKFSSAKNIIKNHIIFEHEELTIKNDPEIFITRLKALKEKPKFFKKPGRPKKVASQNLQELKESPSLIKEPQPTEDGLFWCDKCYKCFKKSRQLTRHICMNQNLTDDSCNSGEENMDNDTTGNFYLYLNRKGSCLNKNIQGNNLGKNSNADNVKVAETVPFFNKEKDKLIFKKHLNFFDYKSVKNMFTKVKTSLKYDSQEYSCKICQKVFPSSSHASMHCLIHTNIKPFKCPECSYSAKSKGNLYIHIKKHTGNFFTCSYCDFKSVNKGHLIEHEATHSSTFQQCKLCKHKYKTMKSLINHVRRYHTDSRGNKYKKYLSSIQKKNAHPCHICHKIFNTIYALTHHYSKHKKNIVKEAMILNEINESEILKNNYNSKETNYLINSDSNNNLECDKQTQTSGKLLSTNIQSESSHHIDVELSSFHKNMHNIPSPDLLEDFDPITDPQILPLLQNIKQISFNEEPTFLNCESDFNNPQSSLSNKDINSTTLSNLIENCQDVPNLVTITSLDNTLNTLCKDDSSIASVPLLLLNNGQNGVEHLNYNVQSSLPLKPILPKNNKQNEVAHLIYQNQSSSSSSFPELTLNDKQEAVKHLDLSIQNLDNEQLDKKSQELTETKLFEKCPRLQAYVCCVCSSIFIESENLKNHLKQHAGDPSNLINEQEIELNSNKVENNDDIDVSKVLQGQSSDLTSFNELLEALYLSSLDKSYYLPELSVNLEYDPALFDAFLEDSSNFTISGNDELELHPKASDNIQD